MAEALDTPDTRCGFVALIGAPNAGKSTLLNALVGAKVSIVTHKVQTTRTLIRGIAIVGWSQMVFVDTPGIFRPRKALDTAMVQSAWSGAQDADVVVLVVDARKPDLDAISAILEGLVAARGPRLLVLNKVDLVDRDRLLPLTADLNARIDFDATFMISALKGDGVADLGQHLAVVMPEGPWLYPEDQLTDLPNRLAAAELTREQLMLRLHDELPYSLTVETDTWTENPDGSVRIDQTIYVERDSQKGIVLGKGGRAIRDIGKAARAEIGDMLGRQAHLFLFVKVRERWTQDPERYRMIGLEPPR